ncbi:MAG: hypothetical protein ACN4GZ_01690 [Acidimicrobiales bacterium]
MTFTYVPAIDPSNLGPTIFSVTLSSGRIIDVTDADTYQPEGPLTTFFRTGSSSPTIDAWSERVASFRTVDIVSIHQCTLDRPVHPSAQNLERAIEEPQVDQRPLLSVVPA